MGALLKKKKIEYKLYKNPMRQMLRCTEDIKTMLNNKRCQRTVFVVDRRGKKDKKIKKQSGTDGDKLYLFQPKEFNEFESNKQELIHSALHHNSISSILPRMKAESKDFAVRDALNGQMFVISWHIISKEEIRCYMFYQGMCFRFFGEDLINLLPIFFADPKKVKKFDLFYNGLVDKGPRIKVMQ